MEYKFAYNVGTFVHYNYYSYCAVHVPAPCIVPLNTHLLRLAPRYSSYDDAESAKFETVVISKVDPRPF